ncbi:MAG: hypothetical protein V3S51_01450 [Dehalococcoidia bacterium]
MLLDADCKTTAMGIMPHTDIEKALELVLSLDIPFWPQLPRVSFHEDMYAQTSQNFPGIVVDLESYSQTIGEPETFALSEDYSLVYHRFLAEDLGGYPAIRGQLTGPVSFGFKIVDEDAKPIIYNDEIRSILFDFIQKKANVQYQELGRRNRNAFVWVDEPGLGWVFSSLSGYNDVQARDEYRDFLSGLEGPRGLHLCANVNLPYLLSLGVQILSFDAYQMEIMPREYANAVAGFLNDGGVICWGIVPTDSTSLGRETPETLSTLLTGYWEAVSQNTGLSPKQIAEQALLSPARCCLKNIGQVGAADEIVWQTANKGKPSTIEEMLVEKAFGYLQELSQMLKERYSL